MDTFRAKIRARLDKNKSHDRSSITKILEARNKKREGISYFKSKLDKSKNKEISSENKKTKSKSSACLTACKPCCNDCPPNALPFAAAKFGSISGMYSYIGNPATAALFDSEMPFYRGLFYSTLIGVPKQNQSTVYEASENEIFFTEETDETLSIYIYTLFRAYVKLVACDNEKLKALASLYSDFMFMVGAFGIQFSFELSSIVVFKQLLTASSKLAGNPPSLLDTLKYYDVYNCKYNVCVTPC